MSRNWLVWTAAPMRDCLPLSGLGLGVSHTEGYKALLFVPVTPYHDAKQQPSVIDLEGLILLTHAIRCSAPMPLVASLAKWLSFLSRAAW